MKSVFAILFLTLFSVSTFAQGKISGTVFDENELTQLNSENIKNVRVIKNPGAKYSAESIIQRFMATTIKSS